MAFVDKQTLLTYFETGDIPTEAQFRDLILNQMNSVDGLNSLSPDDSLSNNSQGGWVKNKTGDVLIVNADSVNITTSNETNSGLKLSGALIPGGTHTVRFKCRLVSGTAVPLRVGYPTNAAWYTEITPVSTETEYSVTFFNGSNSNNLFLMSTGNASSGGVEMEISDVRLELENPTLKALLDDLGIVEISDSVELESALRRAVFLNNSSGSNYNFSVIDSGAETTITWSDELLINFMYKDKYNVYLINNDSSEKTITINSTTQTTAYLHFDDLIAAGHLGIVQPRYARHSDEVLEDPNIIILACRNAGGELRDLTGILAEFAFKDIALAKIDPLDEKVADAQTRNAYNRGALTKDFSAPASPKYGLLVCGQSNAEGRESISNLPGTVPNPQTNTKMFNRVTGVFADFQLGQNSGAATNNSNDWGFDTLLFKKLTDYLTDTIYVAKGTKGGTPISATNLSASDDSLNAFFEDIEASSATSLLNKLESDFYGAKADAVTNGIDIDWKCIVFHQGEADRNTPRDEEYYQNMKDMIAYLRGMVGSPTVPFVFGTIHTDSNRYSAVVNAAQRQIASEDSFVFIVDLDLTTWTHIGDDIHFDAVLNEWVAEEVFQIIKDF